MSDDVLLRVSHLKQHFKSGRLTVKAVDDVSFELKKGEVLGLVGESGCGKTTTGRTIIKLYDATGGEVYFNGNKIMVGVQELQDKLKAAKKAGNAEEVKRLVEQIAEAKAINP